MPSSQNLRIIDLGTGVNSNKQAEFFLRKCEAQQPQPFPALIPVWGALAGDLETRAGLFEHWKKRRPEHTPLWKSLYLTQNGKACKARPHAHLPSPEKTVCPGCCPHPPRRSICLGFQHLRGPRLWLDAALWCNLTPAPTSWKHNFPPVGKRKGHHKPTEEVFIF